MSHVLEDPSAVEVFVLSQYLLQVLEHMLRRIFLTYSQGVQHSAIVLLGKVLEVFVVFDRVLELFCLISVWPQETYFNRIYATSFVGILILVILI